MLALFILHSRNDSLKNLDLNLFVTDSIVFNTSFISNMFDTSVTVSRREFLKIMLASAGVFILGKRRWFGTFYQQKSSH